MSKKLFLLDALSLVYRAHYAFISSPRINSKGLNVSCIFGFANMLIDVIRKEKPTHIAVVFDTHAPTFRHKKFAEYKAHREETPEDIVISIPIIKEMLKAFNIMSLEKDGYEADDVIGTLAKRYATKGLSVYMMTPDKDYAQLVEENIFIYKPATKGVPPKVVKVQDILEKYQIKRTCQVQDILALWGDVSDNVPGVMGIGEKTASKLIQQYDSVENIIENADRIKGKMGENIRKSIQQILLSKELVTIETQTPISATLDDLEYKGFDKAKLEIILDDLEFRNIKARLFEKKVLPSQQMSIFSQPNEEDIVDNDNNIYDNIENTPHTYHLVDTIESIQTLVDALSQQKEFCFDTETTSLDVKEAKLVGLSFSWKKGEGYYVPFACNNSEEIKKTLGYFKSVFENEQIQKVGQNIKYDLLVLKSYDVEVKGKLFDTMIAHYLFEPEARHSMNVMAENYLKYTPIAIETLIGKKGKKQQSMAMVSKERIKEYACEDADITFQLKEEFFSKIKDKSLQVLFDMEMQVVKVLVAMEYEGVKIDIQEFKKISEGLAADIQEVKNEIYKFAKKEFNIASAKQLGVVLFEGLKLVEKPKKTKTGQYATGEDLLLTLQNHHPIINKILDYRELQKLKSTYTDPLPIMVSKTDNRLHTSYNQIATATGRLSSLNPNLQNIPIRTERGRQVRKAFVPRDKNYVLMSADYSQIELRIMASFSQDASMIEAFSQDRDIHAMTASKIFKVSTEDVSDDMRRKAKTANFGIIYGISAFGLAQRLNIQRREASNIINSYFNEFPTIQQYINASIEKAKELGYVETVLGRRRYLSSIGSQNSIMRKFAERNAINAPIQGSAADLIKKAMIDIHYWLESNNLKSKMILQVHDELVFDVFVPEKNLIKEKVSYLMQNAIQFNVPLKVEVGFGNNWLEAH